MDDEGFMLPPVVRTIGGIDLFTCPECGAALADLPFVDTNRQRHARWHRRTERATSNSSRGSE